MVLLTSNVTLSTGDFMLLNIQLYLKRRWYLLAVILGSTALAFALQPQGYIKFILLLAAVWYISVIFLGFGKQSKTSAAAGQLQSRTYQLDGETLRTIFANGDEFATLRSDIVNLDIIAKTYLLFTNPNAYIFLPKRAFVSDAAHEEFKQWLYFPEEILPL